MNYLKIYNRLMAKRIFEPSTEKITHRHHIIPKSMGGNNDKTNIVILSLREHYLAHYMLALHFERCGDRRNWIKNIRAVNVMILGKPIIKKIKLSSKLFKDIQQKWHDTIELKLRYNGQEHSIKEWAKILNVPYQTFRSRIYKMKSTKDKIFTSSLMNGKTIDEKSKTIVQINGNDITIGELSKQCGIPVLNLFKRYVKNGTLENHLHHKSQTPKLSINGQDMNIKELSKNIGIDYEYMRNLIYCRKMSIDEIISNNYKKLNWIDFHGKMTNISDVARKLNVHRNVIYDYLKKGNSIEEAIHKIEQGEYKKKQIRTFSINGEQLSLKEIANKFQISYSSLRVYMAKNNNDINYVLLNCFRKILSQNN